jgi:hypothetical protein
LLTEAVPLIDSYARVKCKIVAANKWSISETWEQGYGDQLLQATRIYHSYSATDLQALEVSLGDPPSIPVTKMDLSAGTVESDNLSALQSGSDDILIRRTGYYRARVIANVANNLGANSNAYLMLVRSVGISDTVLDSSKTTLRPVGFRRPIVEWTGQLNYGDIISVRAGLEANDDAGLRGFEVELEQLPETMLDHVYGPAAIFGLSLPASLPSINGAIKWDVHYSSSGAFSRGIRYRGDGVFELSTGWWLLYATVYIKYDNTTGETDIQWTDVTAAGDPVADAGVALGPSGHSIANQLLFSGGGVSCGRGIAVGEINVASGATKIVKLEKVSVGVLENAQYVTGSAVIRRIR